MSDRPPQQRARRVRLGWALSALGVAAIVAAVLYTTSSSLGGTARAFEERRTYVQVKQEVHRALPLAAGLGLGGLGLLLLGARLRR